MRLRKSSAQRFSIRHIVLISFPVLALATDENATLQVGHDSIDLGTLNTCVSGYSGTAGVGSYSPVGLNADETVLYLYDMNQTSLPTCTDAPIVVRASIFAASGFSIDPGKFWLTVTCNGITKTGASASSYAYDSSSHTAIWQWHSDFKMINKPSGSNVGCNISHS